MRKHSAIRKTGSTQHIVTPLEEEKAAATGNMERKFGEVQTCGF